MITKGLMSSNSNEWTTPQNFYDELNKEFHFTLDPCSTTENHKCKKYFTKKENGLLQSWKNEIVFCNPPYGRELPNWVKKAYEENGFKFVEEKTKGEWSALVMQKGV